jgi:hypothetical protein
MSFRQYAKHRGVSAVAVSQAVKTGRLRRSLTPTKKIRSAAEADREWDATTKGEYVPLTGPTAPKRGKQDPDDDLDPSLADIRSRHELAKARLAEMDLAEREGELVDAAKVEAVMAAEYSTVRSKLLGVPSRLRQRDPSITLAQLKILKDLVREALEGLAENDDQGKGIEAAG